MLFQSPLGVYIYNYGIENEAAPRLTLRFGETCSAIDIWLVPYTRLWGGVCIFSIVVMIFTKKGPDRGVRENHLFGVVADVRR